MSPGALGRVGWDLGGAHLKVAVVGPGGILLRVHQLPCPLWRGLQRLDAALDRLVPEVEGVGALHALTMTGELCDAFSNRAEGVRALVAAMVGRVRGAGLKVYAGPKGFVAPGEAQFFTAAIASANWHASVLFAASRRDAGVFIDIGSTTSDIVPFAGGAVRARGYTDAERLQTEELVYTGVLRTPVMAVVSRVPLGGEWQPLMAEHFATMADVYTLTGQVSAMPPSLLSGIEAADGAGLGLEGCARRLARMAGHDLDPLCLEEWREVARYTAWVQLIRLRRALERVCSHAPEWRTVPLVGAGVGSFVAAALARETRRQYLDFADLIDIPENLRPYATACAPAVAVASLIGP